MKAGNLIDGKPLSLAEAARELPGHPNPSTLWRWRTKGVRGVRLKTILIGGRRHVTPAALDEFITATTAAGETVNEKPSTGAESNSRRQRSADTSRRLRQAGLK